MWWDIYVVYMGMYTYIPVCIIINAVSNVSVKTSGSGQVHHEVMWQW